MKTDKTAKSKMEAPAATHEHHHEQQIAKATTAKSAAGLIIAPSHEVNSELIAMRAYTIWEQEGHPHGHEIDNWLLAESQLKQEIKSLRT